MESRRLRRLRMHKRVARLAIRKGESLELSLLSARVDYNIYILSRAYLRSKILFPSLHNQGRSKVIFWCLVQ